MQKVCKTRTQKIPVKELYESKVDVNEKRKYIKLLVFFSEILHTQILHHVAANQLNFDKIQITGLRKTRDNRAGNLRIIKCQNALNQY